MNQLDHFKQIETLRNFRTNHSVSFSAFCLEASRVNWKKYLEILGQINCPNMSSCAEDKTQRSVKPENREKKLT